MVIGSVFGGKAIPQVVSLRRRGIFKFKHAEKEQYGLLKQININKYKLMAILRQKGPPTLFTTVSCAEYEWDGLAKSIYETINKTEVSTDFIKEKSPPWEKNNLSKCNTIYITF